MPHKSWWFCVACWFWSPNSWWGNLWKMKLWVGVRWNSKRVFWRCVLFLCVVLFCQALWVVVLSTFLTFNHGCWFTSSVRRWQNAIYQWFTGSNSHFGRACLLTKRKLSRALNVFPGKKRQQYIWESGFALLLCRFANVFFSWLEPIGQCLAGRFFWARGIQSTKVLQPN